ncbi:MAG: GntR family transcriptional regulator [bacterium]|nr:GntR family transcriptional regulator [bacterium]
MSEVEIGRLNKLKIVKELSFGAYLDGGSYGEILLPKKYVPTRATVDDIVEVFVYFDSNDCIIATTEKPYATVGEFAYLSVVAVSSVGAFLDWGLLKDLFVAYREQKEKLRENISYPVYIYYDEKSRRIAATTRIAKYLDNEPIKYVVGEEVNLFIHGKEEIGYKAIINNMHRGILYKNEVFQPLKLGQHLKGFIKKIRNDGKIDLCLEKPGYEKIGGLAESILEKLKKQGGFININEKSSPDTIYKAFNVSKKTFKKAIGALYKQRLISIDSEGIKLTKK